MCCKFSSTRRSDTLPERESAGLNVRGRLNRNVLRKGVSSASKVKAQEQWNKAVKKTGSGQKVIEAAQKAVQDQRIQMEVNGDCLCLPDAFRWLRDEMYEALLEAPIIGTQEQQNSDKPLIL